MLVCVITCSDDFAPVSMATLNDELRRSIESYTIELLKDVGQNAGVYTGQSVEVFN